MANYHQANEAGNGEREWYGRNVSTITDRGPANVPEIIIEWAALDRRAVAERGASVDGGRGRSG